MSFVSTRFAVVPNPFSFPTASVRCLSVCRLAGRANEQPLSQQRRPPTLHAARRHPPPLHRGTTATHSDTHTATAATRPPRRVESRRSALRAERAALDFQTPRDPLGRLALPPPRAAHIAHRRRTTAQATQRPGREGHAHRAAALHSPLTDDRCAAAALQSQPPLRSPPSTPFLLQAHTSTLGSLIDSSASQRACAVRFSGSGSAIRAATRAWPSRRRPSSLWDRSSDDQSIGCTFLPPPTRTTLALSSRDSAACDRFRLRLVGA